MAELRGLPLVFIGPMASGKSRLGKRVARLLEVPFVDTDKRIAAKYGPIAEIFDREGEDYFRVVEREEVQQALLEQAVVAVGGGAVLNSETQTQLAGLTVVRLAVSAEAVGRRIRNDSKRPLLAGDTSAWQRIADARAPIYERLASVSFDTSRRPIDKIAHDIVSWLKETP